MAAFTTFSEDALRRYLIMFGKGELTRYEAIAGGIENSNYFITLDHAGILSDYVLTIVEDVSFDEIPFFCKVVTRLAQSGLPVAAPETTLDGMTSTIFCGKPALLVRRLPGSHPTRVDEDQCLQIGRFLGESHLLLKSLDARRTNPYHPDWMKSSLSMLAARIGNDYGLIETTIRDYEMLLSLPLPRGLIHGDLFRDNALFSDEGKLSGVIDFYHACNDLLIQDLAVVLNDWCTGLSGELDQSLCEAVLDGYDKVRPLSNAEKDALPTMQRTTAIRFALTRLLSGEPPRKDPDEMLKLARSLEARPGQLAR